MKKEDLIATEDICSIYKVERTFINYLGEAGLIEIIRVARKEYVHCDKIGDFERLRRLHYDLNINPEGLEAIQHLLNKVKRLQKENIRLRNRLDLFE